MTGGSAAGQTLHASSVALDGRAVLIFGPSGSGKSALALQLMAYGCRLISDDRTLVFAKDGLLWAEAPDAIRGRVEARGLGILAAETIRHAAVQICIDMEQQETDRLPPFRTRNICGLAIPLVHNIAGGHFPAAILQYLKSGRIA